MRGETYILADASLREELEQLELAQRAEAEHRVVERRDLLDRDLAPGRPVDGGAHDAVRALADDIEHLVLRACAGAARRALSSRAGPAIGASARDDAPTLKRTFLGAGWAWEAAWECLDLAAAAAG